MNFLLDTNILSELFKKKPEEKVLRWISRQNDDTLYLSVISIGEIQKGISKLPHSPKREKIQRWLETDLVYRFANRILPVSQDIALLWGKIQGEKEEAGLRLPAMNSLIAATALFHGLVVITRDTDDISKSGAQVLDPWSLLEL